MKTSRQGFVVAMVIIGLAVTVPAVEPGTGGVKRTWTLTTDDTELTLALTDHTMSIVSLRNPVRKWNWTAVPSRVPMPEIQTRKAGQAATWEYRDATEDKKRGHQVTLRFTYADPAMELKSVWRALPGPGPVENEVFIENTSGNKIVLPPTLAAATIDLLADGAVTLHRARKTDAGIGEVLLDVIGVNANFVSDSSIIPLLLLGVGEKHGAYLGYEWELGGFRVTSAAKPRNSRYRCFP